MAHVPEEIEGAGIMLESASPLWLSKGVYMCWKIWSPDCSYRRGIWIKIMDWGNSKESRSFWCAINTLFSKGVSLAQWRNTWAPCREWIPLNWTKSGNASDNKNRVHFIFVNWLVNWWSEGKVLICCKMIVFQPWCNTMWCCVLYW